MLISCVAYENGRKLADIPIEDISEYVKRPNCFVWVALFEPTREELDEMADEFGLHAFDCTNIGSSYVSSLIR